MTEEQIKLGRYQHHKGGFYEVIGIARHSETLEVFVVYKKLSYSKEFGKNTLWVRPIQMFKETIEINGEQIPRFKFVDN